MARIKRYFRLAFKMARLALEVDMTYLPSFYGTLVAAFSHGILRAVTILFITDKVSSIAGWSKSEMLIFVGTYQIFVSLSFYFFYRGMRWFVRGVNNGSFDFVLSKPADSQ